MYEPYEPTFNDDLIIQLQRNNRFYDTASFIFKKNTEATNAEFMKRKEILKGMRPAPLSPARVRRETLPPSTQSIGAKRRIERLGSPPKRLNYID